MLNKIPCTIEGRRGKRRQAIDCPVGREKKVPSLRGAHPPRQKGGWKEEYERKGGRGGGGSVFSILEEE